MVVVYVDPRIWKASYSSMRAGKPISGGLQARTILVGGSVARLSTVVGASFRMRFGWRRRR
jgi:hypothetical protein